MRGNRDPRAIESHLIDVRISSKKKAQGKLFTTNDNLIFCSVFSLDLRYTALYKKRDLLYNVILWITRHRHSTGAVPIMRYQL